MNEVISNWHSWVYVHMQRVGLSSQSFFWEIWKARNDALFQSNCLQPHAIIAGISNLLVNVQHAYGLVNDSAMATSSRRVTYIRASENQFSLHVDGRGKNYSDKIIFFT